ncbi:chemerin-like receptor 2 [Pseudophryne corroboree]|uniref:chemerin-like receptor 2 n=1 Tax=Pseudophryne corroboree TaxID=495146 RepID=UPI003081385E
MDNTTNFYLTPNTTKRVWGVTANIYDNTIENPTYMDYEDVSDNAGISVLHVFSMVIYSLAFLLGTTGNGLVIWFSVFRMKKTVNVMWFLNLAIADFIFTFFLPLSVVYIALGFHWPFGRFICKLNSTVAFLNLFASVFLLTVISIDRCISVIFPVWCQNHRTPRLASIVVLCVWILAFIFSLPYFIFRDTFLHNGRVFCFNNFAEDEGDLFISRHRDTVIMRFIVGFAIPFSIIILCYTVLVLRIQRNHITTSTKPFKIIVAVIISFFVCWFPYHVFSFLEWSASYGADLSDVLQVGIPLTSSLAFINSCVNPFLYVFIGRDFKDKFWTSFQSIFERAFTEDSLQADLQSKSKSTSDSQLV